MNNREIAELFEKVAYLLEIRGDNIHRILSYRRAGETIRDVSQDLSELHEAGQLTSISGIGKTLAEKIAEMLETGRLEFYERLVVEIPESILDLMRVEGLGAKRVKLFYDKLGITTLDGLQEAAENGRLRELPKMGAKSEAKILKAIESLKKHGDGRVLLGTALPIAETILAELRQLPVVTRADIAGSVRRRKETIGDIDLLVAASDAEVVMDHFCGLELAADVALRGPTKSRIVLDNGVGVDLRVLPSENWGTLLSYFTGSQAHNVRLRELAKKKGLSLNEYDLSAVSGNAPPILCETEEAVYTALDLPYVVPTLREDRGEIEAALEGRLPQLVQLTDMRSDLHMHTTWSDGKASILEMAQTAQANGLQYIVITDHSYSLGIANGLDASRLRQQAEAIREANEVIGPDFEIWHGTEMEIRADGTLDFPDEVLAELDFVIAAVHTALKQPREKITERILGAIRNPHVDMIAHPTGRLIGRRDGADVDLEAIFAAAVDHKTILELNANPHRLDLQDTHVRRALEIGVRIAINTDAHHPDQLSFTHFGIATAQRGWATASHIVNSWLPSEMRTFLMSK